MNVFPSAGEIRCAVIGYGGAFNMGYAHLSQMQAVGMSPVAVAELDASRLEVARKDFPDIQTFTSVTEMLATARPNLVTIITPHNTHASLSMQCLEAGASVVSEKPMAITLEECDQMIELARSNDLLLSVYHNRHWDGCILEAMDRVVRKGEIGEVFRVEAHMGRFENPGDWWRTSRSISGGVHYDWGVHLIEYVLQLVNSTVVEVSAFAREGVWKTRWGDDTNQDELTAIVRFTNGILFNLRMTSLDVCPDPFHVVVTGTRGKYFMEQVTYELHRPENGAIHVLKGKNRPSETETYYRNVRDALTGKAELIISPEWSRRTMEVLTAATRSVELNQAVRI